MLKKFYDKLPLLFFLNMISCIAIALYAGYTVGAQAFFGPCVAINFLLFFLGRRLEKEKEPEPQVNVNTPNEVEETLSDYVFKETKELLAHKEDFAHSQAYKESEDSEALKGIYEGMKKEQEEEGRKKAELSTEVSKKVREAISKDLFSMEENKKLTDVQRLGVCLIDRDVYVVVTACPRE